MTVQAMLALSAQSHDRARGKCRAFGKTYLRPLFVCFFSPAFAARRTARFGEGGWRVDPEP